MIVKHVVCSVGLLAFSAMVVAGPNPAGGTVSGKVTYEGTPAKMKPIDMSKEPTCAKMYTTPPLAETVITGSGNSLENVVVYISAGASDESSAPGCVVGGCRPALPWLPVWCWPSQAATWPRGRHRKCPS